MYVCAYSYVCTGIRKGQKRVPDSLKLLLWVVVSHEKKQMLLTPEPFLQPQKHFIKLLSKVSAQKEWQIHNPHSDSIWNIILMTSEEQKKKNHTYEALCATF